MKRPYGKLYTVDELISELQKVRNEYGGDMQILPYWEDGPWDFDFGGFEFIEDDPDDFRIGKIGMFLIG